VREERFRHQKTRQERKRVKKELAVAREEKKNSQNICGRKGKKELAVASDWNNGMVLEKKYVVGWFVHENE
jgi:hypothetical protein